MSVLFPKQIWSCIANFLLIHGIQEKSHFPTIFISLISAVVCHWEVLTGGREESLQKSMERVNPFCQSLSVKLF